MDFSGSLRSLCSDFDGPCPGLLFSCSQIADQSQEPVAGSNQFFKSGFLQAKLFQKQFFLIIVQLGDFLLNLSADNENFASVFCCKLTDGLNVGI